MRIGFTQLLFSIIWIQLKFDNAWIDWQDDITE